MKIFFTITLALLLSACVPSKTITPDNDVTTPGINYKKHNQVLSAKVAEKTETAVYVEVKYYFDDEYIKKANIVLRPISDIYWSHESIKALPGLNSVIVKLEHPNWGNSPGSITIEKIEVMIRVTEYDEMRKSEFAHKLTSKIFDIKHTFNKVKK